TEPGVYNDTAFSLTGIDAVYRLNLSDSRSYKEISLIITAGTVLPPPLGQITQSGTYRFTFTNAAGCDSIVTWYIGVNERCIVPIEEHYTLCAGDAYEWHGQTLVTPGVYRDTLWHSTEEECDTAVVLYLDLLPVARRDTSIAICPGDYWEIGAEKLSEPGDYPISLRAANGCDSILTVHLSYLPDYHDTTRVTIPYGDSFRWEGEEWSDSTEQVRGFIAANGCDSIEVLQLGIDYSLTVEQLEWEGGCGDGDFFTLHVQLSRLVDSVRVTFTEEAKAAGLRDSTVYIHAKQADILIPHAGVRAGSYTCTVALVHGEGTLYAASIAFTLLYPSSVLEQAWNDVVAVLTHDYNGGYDFAAFQWYENGVALSGENHSYLYRPLIIGGEYSALLTESNGTQMMTCPLIVTYQTDISLYPTIVSARQAIQCHVSEEAEIWVYDALGRLIIHGALPVGDTSVPAPGAIGVYIARVVTKANKKEHTYKLIVR
ncbi:MAG: T9SS type A sorting domain-containing protein, partial [Paludibacteraceae bacterium]|nr:T9SS type A sorting domain-containing protein [Paludibacteraceae bacterium]